MEIKTIVIDTNAYVEFKKGNPEAIEIIRKVKNIIMTPIVNGELISGFILGSKERITEKNLKNLSNQKE